MRRLLHELREAWIGGGSPPPEEAAIQAVGWYIRLRPLMPRAGRWGWGALLGIGLLGLGLGMLLMWAVQTVGANGRMGEAVPTVGGRPASAVRPPAGSGSPVRPLPPERIPPENRPVSRVTPPQFTQESHGLYIARTTLPDRPMKDRIPIEVELGGPRLKNLDHFAILVYGYHLDDQRYKEVSPHESQSRIRSMVDTQDLPSGQLTVGALVYLKGDAEGYEIMTSDRLWVDRESPTFDRVLAGPGDGVTLSIREGPLLLQVACQDPGGSGTEEFELGLESQGQIRKLTPRVRGHAGVASCDLSDLRPGSYALVLTYSRDKVGNEFEGAREIGVTYNLRE
jgi:hypothetical protein